MSGKVALLRLSQSIDLLNTLHLSFATISQLELLFNRKTQSTKGSVFESINRTVTPGGKQMLRSWLQSPSAEEVSRMLSFELDDHQRAIGRCGRVAAKSREAIDASRGRMSEREYERKLLQLYGNVDSVLSNLVNKNSESSVRASVRLVKSYLQLIRNCELVVRDGEE